jgi:short-subunit dehydrogenase
MEIEMATHAGQGTAVVTGASSGIGEVYAQRLAGRGYDLVLVARRRPELETLARAISTRTGRKVDTLVADLAEGGDQRLVERRIREDETITLVVNNAGVTVEGPAPGADVDAIDKMLAINVVALTRLSAAAAAAFADRGHGTIVNIASVMAFIPSVAAGAYAASKAYVLHLSRGLQEGFGKQGVRAQAVLPGYTRTPLINTPRLAGLPAEAIMPVEDLVDAALAGLDQGETVTIPPLPDAADWDAYEAARVKLQQNILRAQPAERYRKTAKAA